MGGLLAGSPNVGVWGEIVANEACKATRGVASTGMLEVFWQGEASVAGEGEEVCVGGCPGFGYENNVCGFREGGQ